MPKLFSDPDEIANDIIRDVGKRLVVGLPLGLGKANHIINALYGRASADRSIDLTFFSALTLEKPRPKNLIEARFITPVIDRLFGGYPDLAYAAPLRAGKLPPNIRVIEFFFLAGRRTIQPDHGAAFAGPRAGGERALRQGPLRSQRDGHRGIYRLDRRQHPQARRRRHHPARRVLPGAEIILSRAA